MHLNNEANISMDFIFRSALIIFLIRRIKIHFLQPLKQFRMNVSSYTPARTRHTFYYYVVYSRRALKLPRIEFVEVYKIARSVQEGIPERKLEVLRRVLKL